MRCNRLSRFFEFTESATIINCAMNGLTVSVSQRDRTILQLLHVGVKMDELRQKCVNAASEVRQDYSVAVLPYGDCPDWLGLKDLRQVCDGHATARDRML